MRNAAKILILTLGALSLVACHKSQTNQAANQDMSIDDNLSGNGSAANDIETLPPDESSSATNGELNRGDDNPDVNDVGNGD